MSSSPLFSSSLSPYITPPALLLLLCSARAPFILLLPLLLLLPTLRLLMSFKYSPFPPLGLLTPHPPIFLLSLPELFFFFFFFCLKSCHVPQFQHCCVCCALQMIISTLMIISIIKLTIILSINLFFLYESSENRAEHAKMFCF